MASVSEHNERKALDRWAVIQGWADFDTYLATGGSLVQAYETLVSQRDQIDQALNAIARVRAGAARTIEPVLQGDEP